MTVRILVICGGTGVNLLGQRDALGIHAELQVDWGRGILPIVGQTKDYYSQYVELDRGIGTTGLLFQEAHAWIAGKSSYGLKSLAYLQEKAQSDADTSYLLFLLDNLSASVPLEQSKTSPAIGGLAIRHPYNRAALEQALERITAPLGVGPTNPVEAWIVSSLVGSVGAGAPRFTGAFLADFIRQRYAGTPVLLNFIRIGPLTHRSINPRQTALNAFFGVAADAAFALKLPHGFPGVTTRWFYIDFPDVGVGERGLSLRAQMVEIATKVIMWEGLRERLERLLAHNQGIPMVVVRMGFWEGGLNKRRKYYEALRGLQGRLRDLIEPDYEQKFIRASVQKPQLVADGLAAWMERVRDEEIILQRMESGWRFPRFQMRGFPESLEEVQSLLEGWKTAMEDLVGRRWEDLYAEWVFDGVAGREFLRVAEVGDTQFGSQIWCQQVEEAHMAAAWARFLLGCDLKTGKPVEGGEDNYLKELLEVARRLSSLLNGWGLLKQRKKRAYEAKEWLGKFVESLVAVDALLKLEIRARHFLEKELSLAHQVSQVVEAEFRKWWLEWAQPDYVELIAGDRPPFSFSQVFNTRLGWLQNAENLEAYLRRGWRLPIYREFPTSLVEARAHVRSWKEALQALFEGEWASGGEFVVKRTVIQEGKRQEVTQSLAQWLNEQEKDWQRVENAHFVRAWAWHLLGCDLREGQPVRQPGTLLEQLYSQVQTLSWRQRLARIPIPSWLKQVGQWMSPVLAEFFTTLVQVDYLLQVEEAAANALEQELRGEPVVIVRELSDGIGRSGRLTWLQLLTEGIRQADVEAFKTAVIRGVNGLEECGLCQILGMSRKVSVADIHHELSSRMGQMRINGERVEAPWWAGMQLQAGASFKARLLPLLPAKLQEQLQELASEETSSPEYLFGFSEFMPVAIEVASMAQEFGDTLTAPMTMLKPFVPLVKEVLSEWDYVSASNTPVRQLEIVFAGVWGEPLYELALRVAGLDDEELKKIEQYYTLYRR